MIENLELAKKMYLEDGKLISSIVKQLNIDKNSFIEYLKEFGYYVTEKTRPSTAKKIRAALEECQISNESVTKIAKKYNLTPTLLVNIVKQYFDNVNVVGKPKFNEHIFDVIDTEEKAYWLGFIFADGYIDSSPLYKNKKNNYEFELSLSNKDIEHLQKFSSFIFLKKELYVDDTRCRLSVNSKHFWKILNSYGCVPKKSLILKFPNIDIFSDTSLIRHFIRGYFDGDGYISHRDSIKDTPSVNLLGTPEFLITALSYLNIDQNYKLHQNHNSEKTVYYFETDKKAIIFMKQLYDNSNIYLQRKYEKYCRYCKELQ